MTETQRRHDMFYKRHRARTWGLRDLTDAYIRLRKSREDFKKHGHLDYFPRDFLDYETRLVAALETALGVKMETVRTHTSTLDGSEHVHHDGFDGRTSYGREFTTLIDYLNKVEDLPFGVVLEGSVSREQIEWENRLAAPAKQLSLAVRAMIYELVDSQYPEHTKHSVTDDQLTAAGLDPREILEPDPIMFQ